MAARITIRTREMRRRNLEMFGNRCLKCPSDRNLEFHHQFETEIKGRGRGSYHRMKDVMLHPLSYVLLCRSCHKKEHPGIFPVSVVDQVDDMEEEFLRNHPEVLL